MFYSFAFNREDNTTKNVFFSLNECHFKYLGACLFSVFCNCKFQTEYATHDFFLIRKTFFSLIERVNN